eukprot:764794-Hanusia_phi.AAC.3
MEFLTSAEQSVMVANAMTSDDVWQRVGAPLECLGWLSKGARYLVCCVVHVQRSTLTKLIPTLRYRLSCCRCQLVPLVSNMRENAFEPLVDERAERSTTNLFVPHSFLLALKLSSLRFCLSLYFSHHDHL